MRRSPNPVVVRSAIIGLLVLVCVLFSLAIREYEKTVIPHSYVHATGIDINNKRYRVYTYGHEILFPQWQYYPVIAFTANNGRNYTVNGDLSAPNTPAFQFLQEVPIAYNPKDPSHAVKMLYGGDGEKSGAIALTVVGVMMLTFAGLVYRQRIADGTLKRKRKSR